jgi:hypothetical protein
MSARLSDLFGTLRVPQLAGRVHSMRSTPVDVIGIPNSQMEIFMKHLNIVASAALTAFAAHMYARESEIGASRSGDNAAVLSRWPQVMNRRLVEENERAQSAMGVHG